MKFSLVLIVSFVVLSCQLFGAFGQNSTVCATGTFQYKNSVTNGSITTSVSDTLTLSSGNSITLVETISASASGDSVSCTITLSGTWSQSGSSINAELSACKISGDDACSYSLTCSPGTHAASFSVGANCNSLTIFGANGEFETLTRKSGLSGGAIAGIIIAIVAVAVLVVAGFLFWKRRQGYQPLY